MIYFLVYFMSVLALVSAKPNSKFLSFGVVTDVHIGESCGGDLDYDACKPVRTLTESVNKMNALKLDGVFVTGDITASALLEEFQKAREILDGLQMPWWPLLGNHDSWPYTRHDDTFNQTETPIGDQYFADVFGDILAGRSDEQYAHTRTESWPTKPVPNQDYNYYSWFHNFQVTYPHFSPSLKILALDWVSRGAALPEPGVGPEAELHDYEGGTTHWLQARLAASEAGSKFFLFQHHPFHNWDILDPFGHNKFYNFTFDDKQDKAVQSIMSTRFTVSSFLGSQAGHNHRWFDGPAFTKYTALSEEWQSLPAWETPACKGWFFNEDFTSSIQVFTFGVDSSDNQADSASGSTADSAGAGVPYLANVHGLWRVPNGEWHVKPVF